MKPAATFVAALLRQLRLLLQPPVALRILALALLAAPTLLLLRLGAEGLLLAAAAGVAQGLYGAMFALDLMGRTAQGFARSAGQAAAGSHARLTRAAVLLIIGVAMVALVASSELLPLGMMPLWLLGVAIAALVLPVLVVKQALSDSLGAAAERGSLLEVAARLDRHLLVLAAAVLGAALLGAAVTLWGELVTPRLPLAVVGAAVGWTLLREVATVPPWTILAVGAVAGAWTWQVAPRVWSSAVGALGLMVAWAPPGGTASLPWTALVALAAAGLGWQWVSAPEPTPG